MLDIFVDADGCAVKDEVYKVAERYKLKVFVVANKSQTVPVDPRIEMHVVSGGADAADDWIVDKVTKGDIVITSDLLFADRCIKKMARVLGPKGQELTEDNIGNALSQRELMSNLRAFGEIKGGPSPMAKNDRSQFLSKLDQIINQLKKSVR